MVKEIHKAARLYEKQGYKVVVIGDKKHDEVLGIMGQLRSSVVIVESLADVSARRFKSTDKVAILVQSTQNIDEVMPIVDKIKSLAGKVKFSNTICQPTRIKQKEIKTLPLENDLILVIGSKHSANTQRLYEIAYSLNPRTYWIEDAGDIMPSWFKGVLSVGVTAGASTPDSLIRSVVENIKNNF